jgi:transcriptional regulator with XRE-family HTH domain
LLIFFNKESIEMTLYEKVTYMREQIGISQSELERKAGLSKGTITNWKNGRKPNIASLEKTAAALGCDINLLTDNDDGEKKYYFNEETAKAAQEIFENKELRALFDAARDSDPEDLRALHSMALALKRKERGNTDDTGC